MITLIQLLILIIVLIITMGVSNNFIYKQEKGVMDNIYLNVCNPEKTYYSISNADSTYFTEGGPFYVDSDTCMKNCAYSKKCIGYLYDDSNNVCDILQSDDIKDNTSIKYNCKYPAKNFYNKTYNSDAFRWGAFKKDYINNYHKGKFSKLDTQYWDLCDKNKKIYFYHNIDMEKGTTPVNNVKTDEDCSNICSQDATCLGWYFDLPNKCKLYRNIPNITDDTFTYKCDDSLGNYKNGNWKTNTTEPYNIIEK